MATPQRLPIVNSDDGVWGDIIRQYLQKEHTDTGTDVATNGGHQKITVIAGTTAANTAPIKLTSGALMTTPEAGAIEFLSDNLYFTQTTTTTRKKIATYDDASGATGDIYYRNLSGYLTRLPAGGTGTILTIASGIPSWASSIVGTSIDNTSTVTLKDTNFTLQDATDTTKQVKFDVASVQTTGTSRTITLPAVDSTLATLAGTETLTGKTISGTNNTVSSVSGALFPAVVATQGSETYTIASGSVTQIAGTVVDGYSPAVGDRILVTMAPAASGAGSPFTLTTQPANGVYTITSNTTNLSLSRATDMSGSVHPGGLIVYVQNGSAFGNSLFRVTSPANRSSAFTYGTTSTNWAALINSDPGFNSIYLWNGTYNAHLLPSPSLTATQTITLPSPTTDTLVSRTSTDTLTNKTLTAPVLNGTPSGSSVATAATANTLALRDANGSTAMVNLLEGYTTTATAATTTTLTVASNQQQFFTGATTQIVALPVTSTLSLGFDYVITNNSTGAVTVNSSGGNAIVVMAAGTSATFTCILTSGTTAASWSYAYIGSVVATGKKLTASNTLTLAGTDATTMTFPTTSAAVARTDAAQTFTGVQTFSAAPSFGVLPTGSGVATTATASTLAARDGNANLLADAFIPSATSTTTTAGTTTLTVDSNEVQIFTGPSAQTIVLPSTSIVAGQRYTIINNTSSSILTVNTSNGNALLTIDPTWVGTVTALQAAPTAFTHWIVAQIPGTGNWQSTAATVYSVARRDGNANLLTNNFISGFTTTATNTGTTTLTIASTAIQVFTGTTTHTVRLPTSSVVAGGQYTVINNSTGVVTVQSSGSNTINAMAASTTATFTAVVASPATAANWSSSYVTAGTGNMNTTTYDPAGIAQQVVGTTATQTLTNKSISGSANTLTNIPLSAVTGAANLRTVVNVLDYGALGDNSTDNTSAIAAAQAAVGSTGIVWFPAGIYRHTGITATAGVEIRGAGRGQTILRNTHATNVSVTMHGTAGGPYLPGAKLTALTVDATSLHSGQVGVSLLLAQAIRVVDVEILTHGIGVRHQASWENLYEDVHVHNCTTGWYVPAPGAYTPSCPVQMVACHAVDCTTGLQIDDGMEGMTWTGGDFSRCTNGIILDGNSTSQISFQGINFEGISGDDVHMGSASYGPAAVTFIACRFFWSSTTKTRSIYFQRGDQLVFNTCRWTNSVLVARQDSSTGVMTFIGCNAYGQTHFLDLNGTYGDNIAAVLIGSSANGIGGLGPGSDEKVNTVSASQWLKTNVLYGAGKTTVADADFTTTPVEGAIAGVYNTTDNTFRLAARHYGAWVTMQAYDADLDIWATKVAPSGVVVGTTDTQTLSGKTLTAPVINGASTGSGVSAASTASVIALRDGNANLLANSFINGFTTTATSAITTTLTVASTAIQIFTGTTTQTVKLPTTGVIAGGQYTITNNSTGAITVQSSGANTIATLAANKSGVFTAVVATPTTAANWSQLSLVSTLTSADISDASTIGRNILSSSDATSVRGLIGAAQKQTIPSGDLLINATIDTHPESTGFVIMPHFMNDISYNTIKGGSVIYKRNGTTVTPFDAGNEFKPDATFVSDFGMTSASDTLVVEVTLHRTFIYGNTVGIVMSDYFAEQNVIIEIYDPVAATWLNIYTVSGAQKGVHSAKAYAAGGYNGTNGFSKIRYTLTNTASGGTATRITQIFVIEYDSDLLSSTFLPKGGGKLYGVLDMNNNAMANVSGFTDAAGANVLTTSYAPGATNFIIIGNQTAGLSPGFVAAGSDTNIGLNLIPKGTGRIQANGVTIPTISSADTLTNKTLTAPVLGGTITGTYTFGGIPTFVVKDGTTFTFQNTADTTKQTRFAVPAAQASSSTATLTFPAVSGTLATLAGTETLSSKTLTSPVINTSVSGSAVSTGTTSPSTLALRDGLGNLGANAFASAFATSVTSGTTVVISKGIQVFTGSTAQITTLPTTSVVQGAQYTVINQSSAVVTVQSSGANTITAMAANTTATFTAVVATPTTAANWSSNYVASAAGTTTPTANTLAQWDSNKIMAASAFVPQFSSTTTSGITTTLLLTNTQVQAFIGSANQIVKLPTTGVTPGQSYTIVNQGGGGTLTIQASDGTAITTIPSAGLGMFRSGSSTPTTAGNWVANVNGAGKTLTAINTLNFAGTDGTTMTFPGASDTVAGLTSTQTLTGKTISGASNTLTALPYDVSFMHSVGTRVLGYGTNTMGMKLVRNCTFTSVTFRCGTADASGNLVVELRKNGTTISGTSTTVVAASQVAGGTSTGTWSFTAGDILTVYITAVGTTPGNGLIADIVGLTA